MNFTDELWEEISGIREAIDRLDFVRGLGDGTLPKEKFDYYMAQDAAYLASYARVLAGLAVQTDVPDEGVFWAKCAANAILVERELHASHVVVEGVEVSPTCRAYSDFLLASLSGGEYGVAAAAVLPCFWIYVAVGESLLGAVDDLDGHPYGDWIGMYADPAFAEETLQARAIIDRVAEGASEATRARMREAFVRASTYEWMFWDAAWRMETWPI